MNQSLKDGFLERKYHNFAADGECNTLPSSDHLFVHSELIDLSGKPVGSLYLLQNDFSMFCADFSGQCHRPVFAAIASGQFAQTSKRVFLW
jgi:hypothetical protein